MESCEPVRISCPRCGAHYRIRGEDVFRLKHTSCGKCREVLRIPDDHPKSQAVQEDQILAWLRLRDRDD